MDFINVKTKDCFVYLDACPMCLSKESKIKYIFNKENDIYLKECSNCQTNYYNKFYNPKFLNDAYQGYNERAYEKPVISKLNPIRQFFSNLRKDYLYTPKIDINKKIVDVGCGNGKMLIYYTQKGNQILGMDVDKSMIKKLNSEGLSATYLNLLEDNVPKNLQNKFEVVFFYFVLEHLSKRNVFSKLSILLKRKGSLYITIPNNKSIFSKIFGKYYFLWFFGQHIMFPSKKGLLLVANKYNLKLNKIRHIPDQMEIIGSLVFLYNREIVHPKIIVIKSKIITILSNIILAPILWILSTIGISGNVQYEFRKIK